MNASDTKFGSRFFGHCVSVYALCALLAVPALGQTPAEKGKAPQAQPTPRPGPKSGAPKSGGGKDDQEVKVTDYGTVDISVQDTDLATVLQMLSIESKKNIITSKGVSATVTANLYDVTFQEALKAILDVNGYTYYEEGNFIYVITKDEAAAMEKAKRKTESRVFELQNLSASDAHEFILPLLSEVGKASARGDVQPGMKPDISNAGADSYPYNAKLVVNDYPENLQAIAGLLANLDILPSQVLVEATILQTSIDESNAFGMDFTILGSMNFSDIVSPLSAVNSLLAGKDPTLGFQPPDNNAQSIVSSVGNTAGPGGFKVGILSEDIAVFLRVLDEVTDSTVLARPKIMALNRQRAQVLVGARVGYLSTTATETTTTQSVEFLDTGVELVFRPFISPDGMIRMELSPSVSEASLRSVTDANGQIVTIPDELTNEITTNVRIKDGQTLVLGGLFKESNRVTRRTVPLLGDIPLVGAAFQGQDDKVQRSEIIFLITPTIVHDQALWAAGKDIQGAVDSIRVGARAMLLPFSNDKVTANYNQKAVDAYNRGDNSKSLYYINCSLGTFPNQPEIIRLREKITGNKIQLEDRSLMDRVFRKEVGPLTSKDLGQDIETATVQNQSTSGSTKSETPMTVSFDTDANGDSTPETSGDMTGDATSDTTADASSTDNTAMNSDMSDESMQMQDSSEMTKADSDNQPVMDPLLNDVANTDQPKLERAPTRTEPTHTTSVDPNADPSPNSSASATSSFKSTPSSMSSMSPSSSSSNFRSNSAMASSMASNSSSAGTMSAHELRQQQFLYDFFMALGMPHFAAQYACVGDNDPTSTFPFVTFDNMGQTVSASEMQDPNK